MELRLERLWRQVDNVSRGRVNKAEKERVLSALDRVLDITVCNHEILLCDDPNSGCIDKNSCLSKAHIKCSCPQVSKIPVLEFRWLYGQRNKIGEKSDMMMSGKDAIETDRQNKAAKRKSATAKAELKRQKKEEQEITSSESMIENYENLFETDEVTPEDDYQPAELSVEQKEEVTQSEQKEEVTQSQNTRGNTMSLTNTAMACVRYGVSAAAGAAIASEYLKDLISSGYLAPEMSYLACSRFKIMRAKKRVMKECSEKEGTTENIIGIGYDGRKDNTRAMVKDDTSGKMKMVTVKETHVSVTEEPLGTYLTHFVPETPVHPEKPALKVAQALYEILEENDSLESLMVLQGDSTNENTGWRGGTHTHLEKLLGRKLYWAICNLHSNELSLRHLVIKMDGQTTSDKGFKGPVGKMEFYSNSLY